MLDLTALVSSGATAIISAMATDAWSWARAEISKLLAGDNETRQQDEIARLDAFAADLCTLAERDVHNRVHGYLEARLGDDIALRHAFLTLIRKICVELGIDVPSGQIHASNSIVVQSGGDAHVQIVSGSAPMIRWAAMTAPEAARTLEQLDLTDAVEALTDMEPALAARRLSHVRPDWAQELLSHMDEGLAAELLAKLRAPEQAADLLARLEPSRAAAILDLAVADWTVARLAEMDPDRALVLLASMGSKRTENLLAAMERQQTVRLLGAVSKVLAEQARVRTTFDLAEQEAERIAAQARRDAEETIAQATAEADAIRAGARHYVTPFRPGAHRADDPSTGARQRRPVRTPPPTVFSTGDVTLRLPFDLFFISHGKDGRRRIDQSVLETILFGATLCDLVRFKLVRIERGCPVSVPGAACADPVGGFVLRELHQESGRTVEHWAPDLRRELLLRVVQRLADLRSIVPVTRSRLLSRSTVYYKPTDETAAGQPAVRLTRHLLDASLPVDEETYLLAALVNAADMHGVLPIDLRDRQRRELVNTLLASRRPSPDLRAVLDSTDTAVAALALLPRIR